MTDDVTGAALLPSGSAYSDDSESIDVIIAAFYETISGPAGAPRDWARSRALFVPGARMVAGTPQPNGEVRFEVMDPDSYAASRAPYFAANSFYEREVARRTELHGCIAHVFSTYESRTEPDAEPFMRGVNGIQLLHAHGRWWIVSVVWQHETAPGFPFSRR